jgi:hypothetical protein
MKLNSNGTRSIGSKLLRLLVALMIAGILFGGVAGSAAADTGGNGHGETAVASDECFASIDNDNLEKAQTNITFLSTETDADASQSGDQDAAAASLNPVPLQTGNTTNSTSFCNIKYVGNLMDAAFTVFIGGALVLGLLTWVVTSFTESLPLPSDLKTTLKQQRNTAIASMFRAIFVPAIVITLLDATNIVVPSCITVLPF